MPVRLLHGTSSAKAEKIMAEGFAPISYFCTNVDYAVYYAATGGEDDLQRREELWEEERGFPPREEYGPDKMLMFEHLFPAGERPVVIVIELDDDAFERSRPDNGAEGAVRFDEVVPAGSIVSVHDVDWELADREGYDPLPASWDVPDGAAAFAAGH